MTASTPALPMPSQSYARVRHAASPQGAGTLLVTTLDLTKGLASLKTVRR